MRSGYSMQSRWLLLTRLVLVMLLGVPFPGYAMTVALQWDANVEDDLAGYKVYYKSDLSASTFDGVGAVEGASPLDVQNQTTATISGLDPNQSYTFAVTAYNTSGLESGFSNTVVIPGVMASAPASALTISDALLALQVAVGKASSTTELQSRLDVAPVINGMSVPNGKIDTGDAIVILSNVVGKIAL